MSKSIASLHWVTDPDELELLINVWMYYDPTDFPSIPVLYNVLVMNKDASIRAIKKRIVNKKDWESVDSAPFSDLPDLIERIKSE